MHSLHARLPKNFCLEERLESYQDAIELMPYRYQGRWLEVASDLPFSGAGELRRYEALELDLGCGKGAFTKERAKQVPTHLIVGIDFEPICIAYAAGAAVNEGLHNMICIGWQASRIQEIFAEGELDTIYLNFPTPFPRKKDAKQRIVHAHNLYKLKPLLKEGARVIFKTDSLPLFSYAKKQFVRAGYKLLWISEDARKERPNDPMSWYEERLSKQGATTYAIEATPDRAAQITQDVDGLPDVSDLPVSLVDYLPEDLESLDYIPHGMAGTVVNLINQRKNSDMGTTRRERKHTKWRLKHQSKE